MSQSTASNAPKLKRTPDMFKRSSHGKIGMWMFLITDGLTFSGFLLGYAILRVRNPEWPNPESILGFGLSFTMTFLLVCSSVTMVCAQAACEDKNRKKMLNFLALTILGGLTFLGLQAYEYTHLMNAPEFQMGLTDFAKTSPLANVVPQFASTFYIITGFHGLHVLIGIIYLMVIFAKALKGSYSNGNGNEMEIAGLFWHFVDLVWILVFTFIYLIPKF